MRAHVFSLSLVLLLSACGGGGGLEDAVTPVEKTSRQLAQMCSPDNILQGDALGPTQLGTLADERRWIRAYLNERYLWYKDIPAVNASDARYQITGGSDWKNFIHSINNYFDDLLNPKYTPSGAKVDQFSFLTATYSWNQFAEGEELGYGWLLSEHGSGASRRIWVSYVYPGTRVGSATQAGLQRGDEIISVDGWAVNAPTHATSVDQGLYPSRPETYRFVVKRKGQLGTQSFTLTAAAAVLPQAEHKVVWDSANVKWGYLLFNSHVESAQSPLRAALSDFKSQKIEQLVLDLRYNSGGYLALASALAYGVAGPERTLGKTFEKTRHNDQRSFENESFPFYSIDFDGRAIEALNLSKVYVLTTAETCSASESIINGLRGVDVEVVHIGGTTCGKPYGFVAQDNCGITYAAMEFEGVNDKGQGDYAQGFVPECAVSDDVSRELGTPSEPLFAAAVARHRGQSCPSLSASRALGSAGLQGLGVRGTKLIRPEWQRNKMLRP
jgi:hypothetical protein